MLGPVYRDRELGDLSLKIRCSEVANRIRSPAAEVSLHIDFSADGGCPSQGKKGRMLEIAPDRAECTSCVAYSSEAYFPVIRRMLL